MKTLRTIVLSALLLALFSFGLPAQDALARMSRRAVIAAHRRGNHRHCNHTRAWWRRYRRLSRERQARARKLRLQQQQQQQARQTPQTLPAAARIQEQSVGVQEQPAPTQEQSARAQQQPTRLSPDARPTFRKANTAAPEAQGPRNALDFAVPRSWKLSGATGTGTLKFDVTDRDGRTAGKAVLSPFIVAGPSAALDVVTPRTKLIGGHALPVLRRTIIDRMIDAGGWVVNDFEREMDGRRVYVVLAQVGQGGVAKESWTFYFTEIGGRLYTLATNAPVEMSVPVAADSEQLLAGLRAGGTRMLAVKPGQDE